MREFNSVFDEIFSMKRSRRKRREILLYFTLLSAPTLEETTLEVIDHVVADQKITLAVPNGSRIVNLMYFKPCHRHGFV